MTDTFPSGAPSGGAQREGQPANDVTSALAELERKLRALEQELTSIGHRRLRPEGNVADAPTAAAPQGGAGDVFVGAAPAQAPQTTGRLIDEQAEPEQPARSAPLEHGAIEWASPAERAIPVGQSPDDMQLASLAELRRFRDRVERMGKELTEDYDAMLARVMAGLSGRRPSEPAPTPVAPERAPSAPRSEPAETIFEGRVELGVGPFYDIGSLGAFEQSLAALPSVSEVSIRRFEASHAVVDLRLARPAALVGELRGALQADFSVRQVAEGRMLLTFDDA